MDPPELPPSTPEDKDWSKVESGETPYPRWQIKFKLSSSPVTDMVMDNLYLRLRQGSRERWDAATSSQRTQVVVCSLLAFGPGLLYVGFYGLLMISLLIQRSP